MTYKRKIAAIATAAIIATVAVSNKTKSADTQILRSDVQATKTAATRNMMHKLSDEGYEIMSIESAEASSKNCAAAGMVFYSVGVGDKKHAGGQCLYEDDDPPPEFQKDQD